MTDPSTHLHQLDQWFAQQPAVVVAFSGGVDSSLLAVVAHRVLGDRMHAMLACSPSQGQREKHTAISLAQTFGFDLQLVESNELADPRYRANGPDRCYLCKQHIFGKLKQLAEHYHAIAVDGDNADDLSDHRPGRQAARELDIRSPLAELGITKPQIRAMARQLALPTAALPAMACLASRIPTGSPITRQRLQRIETLENHLQDLGLLGPRLRDHDPIARIEVAPEQFQQVIRHHDQIVQQCRAMGFAYICLELAGYRRGSVNPVAMQTIEETNR